jgi:hypothetical protein
MSPSLWLGLSHESRARRGSNTRPLDLQSNALPTAPQAPGDEDSASKPGLVPSKAA